MTSRGRIWLRRAFAWVLAACALAFVVYAVQLRDRCEDPLSPAGTTRVAVTKDDTGCVLHVASGDVAIPSAVCATLRCEPGLLSTTKQAKLPLLALLLGVYFAGTLAWAARWRVLLSLAGVRMSLLEVWRLTLQAQAGGILLPGGIGGDALRIGSVVGRGAKTSIVVASVLLDRVIGLVTIATLAAAMGLLAGGGAASDAARARVTVVAWALAAIPVGFVAGLFFLRSAALGRLLAPAAAPPAGLRGKVLRALAPVLSYVRDPKAPRAIVVGIAVSLFVSAVQLGVVRGFVLALGGAPLEDKWVYVGTAMAMIVAAVPALPGGWGTADAAYVFFLGPELAGLSPGIALAVCLLYRLFWYISGVVGAILYLIAGARAAGDAPVRRESQENER